MSQSEEPYNLAVACHIEQMDHALTVKELATLLSISPPTIYSRARSGLIPSYRIWGSVRFDPRAIADWIRSQAISIPGTGSRSLHRREDATGKRTSSGFSNGPMPHHGLRPDVLGCPQPTPKPRSSGARNIA